MSEINKDYRVAMIYKPLTDVLGYGGFLERGMRQVCQVAHFLPGEEQNGFDEYVYIDDSPTDYMAPKYRPASYIAIDMLISPLWWSVCKETYFDRLANFDRGYVTTTDAVAYCHERGLPVKFIGFAADPSYHRPLDFPRDRDWVAVWHNCDGRVAAIDAVYKRFPGGQLTWAGGELYTAYINRGKCALNWLRAEMVNMRVFEIMACRTPLITTRYKDMAFYGLVEGEHYLGYDHENIDELLERIGWVQDNPVEAEQMAIRAYNYVVAHHTYRHRAEELIEWLQL